VVLITKIFAPDFISLQDRAEFGSVFNKSIDHFFFAITLEGKAEIWHSELIQNQWSKPKALIRDNDYSYNDPFLSPDEKELYYISNRPVNTKDTILDYNIWYSKKEGNKCQIR